MRNSVRGDQFNVANSFEARLVKVLAQFLLVRETLNANPAFMDFVELWEARFSTCRYDALVCNHRSEHVVLSLLRLAIGNKDMRLLMRQRPTAT